MSYFDKELELKGRHSLAVKEFQRCGLIVNYVDILPIAALFGFKEGIKSEVDRDISNGGTASIPSTAMTTNRTKILFAYRLIVLNMDTDESFLDKADNLFRSSDLIYKNEFESYIRGGIDYLYKELIVNTNKDDAKIAEKINMLFEKLYAMKYGRDGILAACNSALEAQSKEKSSEL